MRQLRQLSLLCCALVLTTSGLAQPVANPFTAVRGKTVMLFSPHPDDDIIGCGGALATIADPTNRLIVVFLTRGEKRTLDPTLRPGTVARIRKREAMAAYRVL